MMQAVEQSGPFVRSPGQTFQRNSNSIGVSPTIQRNQSPPSLPPYGNRHNNGNNIANGSKHINPIPRSDQPRKCIYSFTLLQYYNNILTQINSGTGRLWKKLGR